MILINEGVRVALDIVAGISVTAECVVRTLEQLKLLRGVPKAIRVASGPEMPAEIFEKWCSDNWNTINYIEPGKSNRNAYIERFNRSYRNEIFDSQIFSNIEQVRELSWAWLLSYNEERPHESLGNIPPAKFKRRLNSEMSSLGLRA